jgi:hypothetical protein
LAAVWRTSAVAESSICKVGESYGCRGFGESVKEIFEGEILKTSVNWEDSLGAYDQRLEEYGGGKGGGKGGGGEVVSVDDSGDDDNDDDIWTPLTIGSDCDEVGGIDGEDIDARGWAIAPAATVITQLGVWMVGEKIRGALRTASSGSNSDRTDPVEKARDRNASLVRPRYVYI